MPLHLPTADAPPTPPLRVLLADDHPVVRAGLVALLEQPGGVRVVAQATQGEEAVAGWQASQPDVGLIDLNMPVLDGFGAVAAIRRQAPQARLVVMSALCGDEDVHRALRAGASGYLLKDCGRDELLQCVRQVAQGRRYLQAPASARLAAHVAHEPLTAREGDVLQGLADGLGNKAIARRLGVAEGTVKTHLKGLFAKLDAGTRTQAVREAWQRGLVRPPGAARPG